MFSLRKARVPQLLNLPRTLSGKLLTLHAVLVHVQPLNKNALGERTHSRARILMPPEDDVEARALKGPATQSFAALKISGHTKAPTIATSAYRNALSQI